MRGSSDRGPRRRTFRDDDTTACVGAHNRVGLDHRVPGGHGGRRGLGPRRRRGRPRCARERCGPPGRLAARRRRRGRRDLRARGRHRRRDRRRGIDRDHPRGRHATHHDPRAGAPDLLADCTHDARHVRRDASRGGHASALLRAGEPRGRGRPRALRRRPRWRAHAPRACGGGARAHPRRRRDHRYDARRGRAPVRLRRRRELPRLRRAVRSPRSAGRALRSLRERTRDRARAELAQLPHQRRPSHDLLPDALLARPPRTRRARRRRCPHARGSLRDRRRPRVHRGGDAGELRRRDLPRAEPAPRDRAARRPRRPPGPPSGVGVLAVDRYPGGTRFRARRARPAPRGGHPVLCAVVAGLVWEA